MMGMEPGMYEWVVYTRNQCCMSEKDDLESELFVRVVHNRNQGCTWENLSLIPPALRFAWGNIAPSIIKITFFRLKK